MAEAEHRHMDMPIALTIPPRLPIIQATWQKPNINTGIYQLPLQSQPRVPITQVTWQKYFSSLEIRQQTDDLRSSSDYAGDMPNSKARKGLARNDYSTDIRKINPRKDL
jgi:hypothetical protein